MYRGRWGMVAWALHRVSGLGVLVFLMLHIADTAMLLAGPAWYDRLVRFYRAPAIRLLEVLLAAGVLYHALNGLRIVVLDLWPAATRIHERMLWAVGAVFVAVFVPAAYFMLRPLLT